MSNMLLTEAKAKVVHVRLDLKTFNHKVLKELRNFHRLKAKKIKFLAGYGLTI